MSKYTLRKEFGMKKIVVLAGMMLAACGGRDAQPGNQASVASPAQRPGSGEYALAGDQEWKRPGQWRRIATGTPDGVFVAALSEDPYGTRVVVPQRDGFDVWQADLACGKGTLTYRRAWSSRNGADAPPPSTTPPALDAREVERVCGPRPDGIGTGTPDVIAPRIAMPMTGRP